MKKKRNKKKETKERHLALPLPQVLREDPEQQVFWQVRKGKIENESAIAFYFLLPRFPNLKGKETNELLEQTEAAFFSFLLQKTEKSEETTRFAGLTATLSDGVLSLFAAFSPFDQRQYRAVGTLRVTPEGELQELRF